MLAVLAQRFSTLSGFQPLAPLRRQALDAGMTIDELWHAAERLAQARQMAMRREDDAFSLSEHLGRHPGPPAQQSGPGGRVLR
jgi:hypothetical protein